VTVLEGIALTKSYGEREVVRHVDLEVHPAEVVGLLGPNGAGKTTTFNMIAGGVKPSEGEILLGETDITSLPMYRRARLGITYLPQEASIFRKLSVADNVNAILETVEPNRIARRERLRELLAELGLAEKANRRGDALSGGERRRVEITRALVLDPKFMLLDEPFAGIDPIAVSDIQKIIEQLKIRGIGVIITDHNVRETLSICDRAYIIKDHQTGSPGGDRGRRTGARDLPRGELPTRVEDDGAGAEAAVTPEPAAGDDPAAAASDQAAADESPGAGQRRSAGARGESRPRRGDRGR
jgi:lipopolysaccharide export system ATP-binding protein